MNKIYAFIIILPIISILFLKTMAFYEFDTKQRYIKNTIDSTAHKVMITGVMTAGDKEELAGKLNDLGNFENENIIVECGSMGADGSISSLRPYTVGQILNRGEIFSILVQSKNESTLSRMEGNSADGKHKLHYKAKATCRIEKKQELE
jgi:hypothetical protein